MENIDLHYCSKFEEDLTVFGVVMAQKPPKSPPKWYFLVVGEHLNIDNLATSKALLIKLTTIRYGNGASHFA